jgi:C4-dicarboxylate-specific signal transduction histidine kinase
MKKLYALWALAALALVFAVSWAVETLDTRSRTSDQIESLVSLSQYIENRFFLRHREELGWLCRLKAVEVGLRTGVPVPASLTSLLGQTAGLLGLDVVYLIDRDGKICAASDPLYLGTDVSFRAYFQAGLEGRPSFALARGIVTSTRGLYASAPVFSSGRVIGLVAFRTSAQQLDRYLDSAPGVFLLDPDGKVFAASASIPSDPTSWVWADALRVKIGGQWNRVARHSLTVVPGFTLASLEPEQWPWGLWLVANVVLLLSLLTTVLVWEQFRLVRRRRAEHRDQHQREVLLANLLEGIAVFDHAGRLTWTNPAFDRLAELVPDGPVVHLSDLWDRQGTGPWQQVLDGVRSWVVFEAVLRGRQGAWTPVLAGFNAAEDQFLLSVLDRTERHRSDQLLRHTQKLTVLGQLSGGIAHDLNNMLGVLTGMADLIKMTITEQDPLQESVDLMLVTLSRAANLSEKMLNFARQTPIERNPLDVASLLRELRFLARTALPEGIVTVVEADEGPAPVLGDENLLLSALLNLVLYAGEAMPGGGQVRVVGTVDGDRYRIEVVDQGAGMDKATLARVFEPFFSTKGNQGTGLGLSLVRRTIVEHRGTIKVESAAGKGTRVILLLPLVPVTGSPIPESAPPLPAKA